MDNGNIRDTYKELKHGCQSRSGKPKEDIRDTYKELKRTSKYDIKQDKWKILEIPIRN